MTFQNFSEYQGPQAERFTQPSMTVPDMSLDIRTLVERYMRGDRVKTFQTSNVPADSIIPSDFERMDLVDKAVLSRQLSDFVATSRGKLMSAREVKRKQRFEDIVSARVKAALVPKDDSQPPSVDFDLPKKGNA